MAHALASMAFAAGISFLAGLLRGKPDDAPLRDKRSPTLAERGAPLRILIGTRRVGPVVGWVGDQKSRSTGGGKGVDSTEQEILFESAFHLLAIGPSYSLTKIFRSDKVIWGDRDGEYIDVIGTASGTEITTRNRGKFRIYWGEGNQPLDSYLAEQIQVSSRFPHMTYVLWNRHKKGTSEQWPLIEYELTNRPCTDLLSSSAPWLTSANCDGTITESGANPAHALAQLLCSPFPWGCGIDPRLVDCGRLEALGVLCENEHIPFNIDADNAVEAATLIASMLQDLGVSLPQVGRVIVPLSIRYTDPATLPTFDSDSIVSPRPELRRRHDGGSAERLRWTFADRDHDYRDNYVPSNNDAGTAQRGQIRSRKIEIVTATDYRTVEKIANRREYEEWAPPEKRVFKLSRGGRNLVAGQAFIIDGEGQFRVLSVQMDDGRPEARIECLLDQYSYELSGYQGDPPPPPPDYPEPEPDPHFQLVELPWALVGEATAVGVVRDRANAETVGAFVHLSADGSSYTNVGEQNNVSYVGTLATDWDEDDGFEIEDGPEIVPSNDFDFEDVVQDLSSSETQWRSGYQIMIVGDEIMYLRNTSPGTGNNVVLNGVLRARFDTIRHTHPAGTPVFVISSDDTEIFQSALLVPGNSVYAKTQPYVIGGDTVDLADVVADSITLKHRATAPIPPDNFHANERRNNYIAGGDVVFSWTYRVRNADGYAVDDLGAGAALGSNPSREGPFVLRIYNAGVLVRTTEIDDDTGSTTYPNATMVSDFGAEPASFTARISNKVGNIESDYREITITKV